MTYVLKYGITHFIEICRVVTVKVYHVAVVHAQQSHMIMSSTVKDRRPASRASYSVAVETCSFLSGAITGAASVATFSRLCNSRVWCTGLLAHCHICII